MAKRKRISDKQLIKKLKIERKRLQNVLKKERKLVMERRKLMKIKNELKKLRVETGRDIISKMKRTKVNPEKRRKAKKILSKIGRRLDQIDFSFDDV